MKKLIFILMLAFVAPQVVEAKSPTRTHHSQRRVRKAAKESLPFAKVHDRRLNRKGLTR